MNDCSDQLLHVRRKLCHGVQEVDAHEVPQTAQSGHAPARIPEPTPLEHWHHHDSFESVRGGVIGERVLPVLVPVASVQVAALASAALDEEDREVCTTDAVAFAPCGGLPAPAVQLLTKPQWPGGQWVPCTDSALDGLQDWQLDCYLPTHEGSDNVDLLGFPPLATAPGFHRQADNQVVAHLSVWPSASRGQCLAVFARDVASRLVPLSVEVSTLQLSSYPSAGVSTLGTRDSETVDSAMVTGLNCLNHLQAPSSFRPSPPSQAQRGRL